MHYGIYKLQYNTYRQFTIPTEFYKCLFWCSNNNFDVYLIQEIPIESACTHNKITLYLCCNIRNLFFFDECRITFLLQELIQNADDARATEVKFFVDCRQMQTLPLSVAKHDEVLYHRFHGPALISYNNGAFKENDWEGIRNLQCSEKAKNAHKVGTFGIGFNSVYHITGKLISSFI